MCCFAYKGWCRDAKIGKKLIMWRNRLRPCPAPLVDIVHIVWSYIYLVVSRLCVTLYILAVSGLCDLYAYSIGGGFLCSYIYIYIYIQQIVCLHLYIYHFYSIDMYRLNIVDLPDLLFTCAKMCLKIWYFIRTYLIPTWHFSFYVT